MAVVGKGFAVLQSGKVRASGGLVWLVWLAVHAGCWSVVARGAAAPVRKRVEGVARA